MKNTIVQKILLAMLAAFAGLSVGCSTPDVYNTPSEEGTGWWAYSQCLQTLSRYESTAKCNSIGVTSGASYREYTVSRSASTSDVQSTSSSALKLVRPVLSEEEATSAYRAYVQALDENTQAELAAQWLALAQEYAQK